ncbi:MAG: tetratricopeptide repeat protein [Vulcanimicrobiota bacterium]
MAQSRPPFDQLLGRAEAALKANELEKAVILYEKLANFYPESSMAHNRLGYAHFLRGNDPRAIYSFRTALSLNRNNDEALHNLLLASGRQADALARDNSFAEAASILDDLVRAYSWHPQHAVLLYYRGRLEFLRGRPDDGLAWWKKAAAQAPGSGVSKVVAAQARPMADALPLYQAASDNVKTEPGFDFLLGKRYEDVKQYEQAYAAYSKGLEKSRAANIPFPLLSLELAEVALITGRTQEAITVLEEAKKQRPDWASLRTLLWPAYLVAGNSTAADAALQEAYELDSRPKLALLGESNPVRITTANGSFLMVPPAATSLPPGSITVSPEGGTAGKITVGSDQALIYRLAGGTLQSESSATLVSNAGTAGQLAPPLVAKDRRGRFYRLAEFLLKKPIVVLFWDCADADSTRQLAELGAIASRFGERVETVAIHTDPNNQKEALKQYLSQPGTSSQVWGDKSIAQTFGITSSPSLVVIDLNGRITLSRSGSVEVLFEGVPEYTETLTGP